MPMCRTTVLVLTAALALALPACAGDDGGSQDGAADTTADTAADTPAGTTAACVTEGTVPGSGTEVAVGLDEWTVTVAPDSVPAGTVTLVAGNTGDEVHEVVVVRGSSVDELPLSEGAVDEEALPDGAFVGEIEGFPAGATCEGSFELAAGDYVLFCNIVEQEADDSLESHVQEGMATTFTVS